MEKDMARLSVFISSTFYDLQHIRTSLEEFVERLGYDAILSEKGRIAYDPDIPLDESCYREAENCDIFVLIIGGRYGSPASDQENTSDMPKGHYESVTKKEYKRALEKDKPIYILVEQDVLSEYRFWRNNKDTDARYNIDTNIFCFIEEILSQRRNNPVQPFSAISDIENWLKSQWTGLFKEFINRRSEHKQLSSLTDKISELSSINASLQRYMETIVSRVSSSPQEAEQIISTEKKFLEDERALREFHSNSIIMTLSTGYFLAHSVIESIFREATSIDNLLSRAEEATNGEIDSSEVVEKWKKNPDRVEEVNQARSLLKKGPLKFENKKTQ